MNDFSTQWRDVFVRRVALWGLFLLLATVPLPLTFLLGNAVFWPLVLVFSSALVAVGVWHHRFRCPRCHEWFFRSQNLGVYHQTPFTGHCLNCGIAAKGPPHF